MNLEIMEIMILSGTRGSPILLLKIKILGILIIKNKGIELTKVTETILK